MKADTIASAVDVVAVAAAVACDFEKQREHVGVVASPETWVLGLPN